MPILSNTLVTLRQGLMNYLHRDVWINGTTSASAAATAKTLTDSVTLTRFQDDSFNSMYALLTSGSNSTNFQKASDFAQSIGVVSLLGAFSAAIAASVSYEILPYHPATITWALNKALQEIYHKAYKSILNEDLITGNALPNSDFEDWAATSVPDKWANSTATAAKETNTIRYNRASLKVTGGASAGNAYISQVEWPQLLDLAGYSIDFEAWCWTDTASHARLGIFDDDGTTWSSYDAGNSKWNLLKATRTIKSATKTVGFRLTGDVNAAKAYYDRARAMNGPVSEYVLPSELIQGDVKNVYIQEGSGVLNTNERPCDDMGWVKQPRLLASKPKVRYDERLGVWLLSFAEKPTGGYKIRLEGIEPQTKLSVDTDTVSLSETHLNLLYPYAAYVLLEAYGRSGEAQKHLAKYNDLKTRLSMPAIPCYATHPWGRW